jgi:DNA-binding response OmpR family regulator
MAFGAWPSQELLREAAQALPTSDQVAEELNRPLPNQRRIGTRVVVDLDARVVYLDGEPVSLGRLEYNLLTYLLENPRRALSREQILRNVYGHGYASIDSTARVDLLAGRVRRRLKLDCHLVAVLGYGYRLDP